MWDKRFVDEGWLVVGLAVVSVLSVGVVHAQSVAEAPEELDVTTSYEQVPGVDMTVMSAEEKSRFLERVNSEKCTCGCNDDSIAWCVHHHQDCHFALPLARLIASEVSPNYEKLQDEADLVNWEKFQNPTENMLMFFDYLKGFDLSELSEVQRERLLQKANVIACDCGCVGDTLARCVNIDPTCPVAPARIRELIEEIKVTAIAP